jgi:hypothetical protein
MLLYLLLLRAASGFRFIVEEPYQNSEWFPGTSMDIRWKMDNITLPYEPLAITVDLLYFTTEWTFLREIDASVDNVGTYRWTIPSDLPPSQKFQIQVCGNDAKSIFSLNGLQDREQGFSPEFGVIYKTAAANQLIVYCQGPTETLFPGQNVKISFTKSTTLPDFPYGVHIELQDQRSNSFLTLARNVSFGLSNSGYFDWTVPFDLPKTPELSFYGQIIAWGYDAKSGGPVLGERPTQFDFTNTIKLQILFALPRSDTWWQFQHSEPLVLNLFPEFGDSVQQRDVKLDLSVFNDKNQKMLDIFLQHFIAEEQWQKGTHLLNIPIPDKKAFGIDNRDVNESYSIRLYFKASYRGKERSRFFETEGYSDMFIISNIEKPKDPNGGSIIAVSSLSMLCLVVVLLLQ